MPPGSSRLNPGLSALWVDVPGLPGLARWTLAALGAADPGGTWHQGVWIAPLAAALARLRPRGRTAARAIPLILNVVMPLQEALQLPQLVNTAARCGCCRLVSRSCHLWHLPTGTMQESVTPPVLRQPSSNIQIRSSGQLVQGCLILSAFWVDIPGCRRMTDVV